jgi:hypothetical protein
MNDENTLLDEKPAYFWLKHERDEPLRSALEIGYTETLNMRTVTQYSIISSISHYLVERMSYNPNNSDLDYILSRIQELSEDEAKGLIKAILHVNRGQNLFTLKEGNDYKSRSKDARLVLDGNPLRFWLPNNKNPLISEIVSIWGKNLYRLMPIDGYILIHYLTKQVEESYVKAGYCHRDDMRYYQHELYVCCTAVRSSKSSILWAMKAIIHCKKG